MRKLCRDLLLNHLTETFRLSAPRYLNIISSPQKGIPYRRTSLPNDSWQR